MAPHGTECTKLCVKRKTESALDALRGPTPDMDELPVDANKGRRNLPRQAKTGTIEWDNSDHTLEFGSGSESESESESDVLPAFESRCLVDPVFPKTDPRGQQKSQGKKPKESLNIQTQKEDDIRGSWFVISQLGEGTYGCVKLIEDTQQKRLLAMKVISHVTAEDGHSDGGTPDAVKKEIAIHKSVKHKNVVQFLGSRIFDRETFIFLEYACGGELYDRIEPDFGVPRSKCKAWFSNLIDGLTYLHSVGICHRDIKPENCLLTESDQLKISDFGLSTYFRLKGMMRMISTRCGTTSYVAPEVYQRKEFQGEPLDIWSAGIVLVAMVSGELPWEEAHPNHSAFCSWLIGSISESPWNKMPSECIGLLRKMLDPNPDQRAGIAVIQNNYFYKRGFTERALVAPPPKRTKFEDIPLSMPALRAADRFETSQDASQLADTTNAIRNDLFSQPVRLEDLLCSQSQAGDSSTLEEQNPLARLVKRLTRFFLTCGVKEAIDTLTEILTPMHMTICRVSAGSYMVTGQDRHKGHLAIKISFVKVHEKLLMDFRLSKGDGLEFKRVFPILREKLNDLIDDEEVQWTTRTDMD